MAHLDENTAKLDSTYSQLNTVSNRVEIIWNMNYLASDHFVPVGINNVRILSVYKKAHSLRVTLAFNFIDAFRIRLMCTKW